MRTLLGVLVLSVVTVGLASADSITVWQPGPGWFWPKGKMWDMHWQKEGTLPDQVKITLRDETSTSELMVIADPAPNSGSYSWAPPLSTANGKYVIRVKAKGANIHGDSGVFNIHNYAKLTITSPQHNEVWPETTTRVITWTKQGNLSATVRIYLGLQMPPFSSVRVIADPAPNSGSFTWAVPGDVSIGHYKIWIFYRCADYPPNWNELHDNVPFELGLKGIVLRKK